MAIPAESFFLDPAYPGTLQQQIQELIIEGVLSGRLMPGERMPSSRKLATHFGVSRITVTLAYNELVSNDYLAAHARSGYFISSSAPRPPRFRPPDAAEAGVDWSRAISQRFSDYAPLVRPPDWRSYRYPFIYGQADATLFDHQNWRQCALKALGQRDFEALTSDYYNSDDPRLVDFIARHILPRRGIAAQPDEVLLTLGAQNALWLAAQVLLTQRRTAAIENPCYPGLREILDQTRCKLVAVDVDKDGLPPERIPPEVDVLFCTPGRHCPSGAAMTAARRRALLERAAADGLIVVEDDYEFEVAYDGVPSPALKSRDRTGAVVYIGSFSKSLFPGLRLGYLAGARAFIREARALRSLILRHPPGHLQRSVSYFLSLGHYDAQMSRMAAAFGERRRAMADAIRDCGLNVAGGEKGGGSSFWMRAPRGVDTTALAAALREKGVLIEPGRAFFGPDDENRSFYRLGFSSIPVSRIADGIARIAESIAETGHTRSI